MRLIQLNINPQVVRYLERHVAEELKFPNKGLVLDIFSLLRRKGDGIPTEELLDKLIEHFTTVENTDKFTTSLLLRKQRHVLTKLEKTAFFRTLCHVADPIRATRQLIEYSMNVMFHVSKAYCEQCNLNSACHFYTHFRDIKDISVVAGDSSLLNHVHDDCPRRPELDIEDMIAKGADLLAKLLRIKDPQQAANANKMEEAESGQPDEGDPDYELLGEDSDGPNSDFDKAIQALKDDDGFTSAGKGSAIPQHALHKLYGYLEAIGRDLSEKEVAMFALGLAFEDAFGAPMRKDMFRNTDALGTRRITDTTHKHSDLVKGKPEDLMHDDDIVERKVNQGDMRIRQEQEQKERKVHVYVLIDVSYSMDEEVTTNISRLVVAKTLVFALLEKLRQDNAVFIGRAFNDNLGERVYAESDSEYDYAYKRMVEQLVASGGTDINNALSRAMKEILQAQDKVSDAEILLITDSEDRFRQDDYDEAKKILAQWPESILHVINADQLETHDKGVDTLEKYINEFGQSDWGYPAQLILKDLAKRFVAIDVDSNGQLNLDAILNTISI